MGLYRRLYGARIEPQILAKREFHGSEVRDALINLSMGFAVDNHAEKILQELVEEGVLEVLQRAPTHSQAAFAGLQYSAKSYRDVPWGPGVIEHHWYRVL